MKHGNRLKHMEKAVYGPIREQQERERMEQRRREVAQIIEDVTSGKIPPMTDEEAEEFMEQVKRDARKHFGQGNQTRQCQQKCREARPPSTVHSNIISNLGNSKRLWQESLPKPL